MPEGRPQLFVIKRQILKGIHSSTRTVYEWLGREPNEARRYGWSEDRLNADTFNASEAEETLQFQRRVNHAHGRVLCTMKEPA